MSLLFVAAALADPSPPRVEAVHPISPVHLSVLIDEDTAFDRDPARWTLSGPQERTIEGLAVRTRAAALIPEGWPYPVVREHEVIVELDAPLVPGTWTLANGSSSWELAFDPERDWTPSVQLNQVGWRADAPRRYAYAGYWVVGLEPVPLEGARWHVVDAADGETVLEGAWGLRLDATTGTEDEYGSNYSNADVYEADLTALGAGEYFLVWEGVGRSWTFTVDDAVYDEPFRAAFRALYHQRCGTSVVGSPWGHAEACHVGPVTLSDADYQVVGEDAFEALQSTSTGVQLAAAGGYHDAGDYSRRTSHLDLVDALVDLYELDPARHAWDDAGLPESGNGIPDLLDEAAWGLGFYAQMQGATGGIRGGSDTTGYPAVDLAPEDDTATTWYAYNEDPRSSYIFAGAAAKVARALAPFDAEASAGWLDRAKKAWAWAEANPRGYDTNVHAVEAAAQLLLATGDPAWDEIFKSRGPFSGGLGWRLARWDGVEWYDALYAYAGADQGSADVREAARAVLIARADDWIDAAGGTGRRLVKHPYAGIAAGAATTPVEAGLLIRVHHLTGEPEYLEWATYSCDHALGGSASGWSWVTGVGDRPVVGVFHTPSLADDVEQPLPGITVYGPAHYTTSSGIHGQVISAYDPPIAEWPVMERYADVTYSPVINEFTVTESIGPTLFAFGALAEWRFDGEEPGDTDEGDTDEADTDDPDPRDAARGRCGCATTAPGAPLWLIGGALLAGMRRRRGSFAA